MSISPIGIFPGASAVQNVQFSQLQSPVQSLVQAGSADFASAVSKAAFDTMNTIKAGESISMDGLAGRAGLQDVVEGVMAAERSFSTALAVRDKIVSAYLELSRMTV